MFLFAIGYFRVLSIEVVILFPFMNSNEVLKFYPYLFQWANALFRIH